MPNPILSSVQRNLSKRRPVGQTAIEPVPDNPAGYNNPYRGTEAHGVEPITPEQHDYDADRGHGREAYVYDEEKEPQPPIPVRIVGEDSDELPTFRTARHYVAGSQAVSVLGRDKRRRSVKIKNVSTTDKENLIGNGQFETNTDGWVSRHGVQATITRSLAWTKLGAGSLLSVSTSATADQGGAINYKFVPIEPNLSYNVFATSRLKAGSPNSTMQIRFELWWVDAGFSDISMAGSGAQAVTQTADTTYSWRVVAPSNAVAFRLEARMATPAINDGFHLDDVRMEKVNTPARTVLIAANAADVSQFGWPLRAGEEISLASGGAEEIYAMAQDSTTDGAASLLLLWETSRNG